MEPKNGGLEDDYISFSLGLFLGSNFQGCISFSARPKFVRVGSSLPEIPLLQEVQRERMSLPFSSQTCSFTVAVSWTCVAC